MIPFKKLLTATATAAALAAPAAAGQRTTVRPLRPAPSAGADTAAPDTIQGAAADSLLIFSGYEKTLRSSKETLFVTNRGTRSLCTVIFTITYYDAAGRQLHSRTVSRHTDLPAGETRRLDFAAWDTQHTTYFSGGPHTLHHKSQLTQSRGRTMIKHPIEHIKQFVSLRPEEESALRDMMVERTMKKGETIRGTVNLTTFAFFLAEGAARMFYIIKGKEHTIDFIFDNGFIIVPSIILQKCPDTVTVQFLEKSRIIYLPHLRIKDFLKGKGSVDNYQALLFLNAAVMSYNAVLEERLNMVQNLSSEEKYSWVLERYPRILERATITQIASFLGVTKETLYRIRAGKY